jgi:hypothetical protein
MATREGEYPFATIIVLDGNVAADAFNDAVRNVSPKPDFRRAACSTSCAADGRA